MTNYFLKDTQTAETIAGGTLDHIERYLKPRIPDGCYAFVGPRLKLYSLRIHEAVMPDTSRCWRSTLAADPRPAEGTVLELSGNEVAP
jgi:hypothetical protein